MLSSVARSATATAEVSRLFPLRKRPRYAEIGRKLSGHVKTVFLFCNPDTTASTRAIADYQLLMKILSVGTAKAVSRS